MSTQRRLILYAGYLVTKTKPRRLVYEPQHPYAIWLILTDMNNGCSLLRELNEGRWEQIHRVHYKPFTLSEIKMAKIKIVRCCPLIFTFANGLLARTRQKSMILTEDPAPS
jgi:hypothetical protein